MTFDPPLRRLTPPATVTCPHCGGGLPAAELSACPSCGNPMGAGLFGTAPPPLPVHPVAPEPVAPEAVAPEPVAPEAVAPEAVAPEAVAPEPVAPEPVAPEPVAPEPAEAGAAESPEPTPADHPAELEAVGPALASREAGAPAPASDPGVPAAQPGPGVATAPADPAVPDAAPDPAPLPQAAAARGGRRSMLVLGSDASQLRPLPETPPAPAEDYGQCAQCGGRFDADGYCTECGASRPNPRDHLTAAPAPWLAGVCDRGIRHADNQDAMALRVDPNHPGRAALVVCDGVTTAARSAEASLAAAEAAADVLASSRAQGLGLASAREAALTARLEAAADAAVEAVCEVTDALTREHADAVRAGHAAALDAETGASLPACTFVGAVVEEDLVIVGSVGDSRAYWLPDGPHEPVLLTEDDSFAQEQIRHGADRASAESGPHAHTITRWLGVDAPDHTPASRALVPTGPGWLLLCSDGLWNYASEATDLAAVVRRVGDETGGPDPLALAQGLIRWANQQGGRDNITAVLARVDVPAAGVDEATGAGEATGVDEATGEGGPGGASEAAAEAPTVALTPPTSEDGRHG